MEMLDIMNDKSFKSSERRGNLVLLMENETLAELDCAVWIEVLNDKQLATVLAAVEEITKAGASQNLGGRKKQ